MLLCSKLLIVVSRTYALSISGTVFNDEVTNPVLSFLFSLSVPSWQLIFSSCNVESYMSCLDSLIREVITWLTCVGFTLLLV